jgi:hypothetical protein
MSRERFLSLLALYLEQTAWVLMDNHYHLVLRLNDRELWELMKPLNMHYAHYRRKKTAAGDLCSWIVSSP